MLKIYSKELYPTRKDKYGDDKLASRTTKHYITTKKLYDSKGKVLFSIEVTSFRRNKRNGRIIMEGTTLQNVTAEVPSVARNLLRAVEIGKIKAKAGHYAELEYDMTTFSPTLIERFVNFKLIDYMIRYERAYNTELKKSIYTYKSVVSKKKVGNKTVKKRYNKVYRYYRVTNRNRLDTSIESKSINETKRMLSEYDLDMSRRKGSYYGTESNI